MSRYRFPCGCEFTILEEAPGPDVLPLLDFDIEAIPESCPATWELLGRGLTKGIFQLESPLGRQWTKRLKPQSCEHMGALGALLRPGPLKGVDEEGVSMTEHYVRRKNGLEEVKSFHPALDPLLQKTYNVLCFQEQMMFIARDIAGFDLVGMDRLRKAVGKKDQQALAKVRDEFLAGAARLGIVNEEQARTIWGWIQAAGRYAFNKAHADCYGIRGYKTAYIKAHFPLAFFAAWLRNARHKSDPRQEVHELVNDARLFDVVVEPPDLRSLEPFVHSDRRVVKFGLADIKGVGEAQVLKLQESVRAAQASLGKPLPEWRWLELLVLVLAELPVSTVERFIQAGALRHLPQSRRRLLAEHAAWLELTETERQWLRQHLAEHVELADALQALGRPRYRKPRQWKEKVVLPGHTAQVEALRGRRQELLARRRSLEREQKEEASGELRNVKKQLQEVNSLLRQLVMTVECCEPEPAGPFGGCFSDQRESIVRSLARALEKPPAALVDTPGWLVEREEDLLGIALSCSKVDGCDIGAVNCTCKEARAGRSGTLVLGVTVQAVSETTTRAGKAPGSRMARLVLADGSCAVEAVAFPDVWREHRHLLVKDNTVIVQGERDRRGHDSIIINKVWQALGQAH